MPYKGQVEKTPVQEIYTAEAPVKVLYTAMQSV